MGEAKRRRQGWSKSWPSEESHRGTVKLHALPPVDSINGARIRELTGAVEIPDHVKVIVRAFRAAVGSRIFHVGFCLGDGGGYSAVGIAVIERLTMEEPGSPLHVVPVKHADVAWDLVLRHLRTFSGTLLLFTFPDSDVYDAGVAEIHYSSFVQQFDTEGMPIGRLTSRQRRDVRARQEAMHGRATAAEILSSEWSNRRGCPVDFPRRNTSWQSHSYRCVEWSAQLRPRLARGHHQVGRRR